ncbi:MAG: polysaccharide biosynthesis/export family protein [Verrucomicrobia bacterium]|nr:polysaccharide biosynthesis/export family protein [Verrucomicrobiota bacterium]
MSSPRKIFQRTTITAMLLATPALVTACDSFLRNETPDRSGAPAAGKTSEALNVGDLVTVVFSDTPTPTLPFEERVKDDGTITLLLNQTFQVAGKTRSAVEREVRARYVPAYFVNLTVTVKPQERYFYVNGEVKTPSRQPHPGELTVLKAIASAQGFTDFANKKKVRLTRADGHTVIVNCEKALKDAQLDLPVYPGDKVDVPRSIW